MVAFKTEEVITIPHRSLARAFRPPGAEYNLQEEFFPMHTVSMFAFMGLELMEPFEVLLARGAAGPTQLEAVVHFISHEWLGRQHPDPEGVHLRRMQQVFHDILKGHATDLFAPASWMAFTHRLSASPQVCGRDGVGGVLTEELLRRHVALGEVWIDFGSVPQAGGAQQSSQRHDAVRSVPGYLERSQYFWVLAPPARHADTGRWCGFATWRSRGWCRLEEWGNFLKARPCMPLIITHSQKLSTMGFADFLGACQGRPSMAPCAGAFACCEQGHELALPSGERQAVPCDKAVVAAVLSKLFRAKREHLRALGPPGALWHALLVGRVGPILLGGAPDELVQPDSGGAADESLAGFLERFGLPSVGEAPAPGFSVWCCAAMAGQTPMLQKLRDEPKALEHLGEVVHDMNLVHCAVQQGHIQVLAFLLESSLVHPGSLNSRSFSAGCTALDWAAKSGHSAVVDFLLDWKADLLAQRADGCTPLHFAAMSGHAACCEALVRRRADVGAKDSSGRAPIHLAADPVTLYGDAEGKLATLQALLRYGADPLLEDAAGQTALAIAAGCSFVEAEGLLQAAADAVPETAARAAPP